MPRLTAADDDTVTLIRKVPLHWLLFATTLASALPLAAIIAAATPMPEGACSGIGWGCSLYGWDAAGFALVIFGVPYAVLLAATLVILSFVGRRAAPTVGWIGLLVPWIVVLFGAVS